MKRERLPKREIVSPPFSWVCPAVFLGRVENGEHGGGKLLTCVVEGLVLSGRERDPHYFERLTEHGEQGAWPSPKMREGECREFMNTIIWCDVLETQLRSAEDVCGRLVESVLAGVGG